MRNIKFRAYIKEDYNEELIGKMLDVSSIHLKTGKVIIGYSLRNSNYGNKSFLYKNIKLMQFTGLHDKNGKGIYEGDIISNGHEKCIVVWVKEYAGFMLKLINKEYEDKEWTNPMIDLRKDEEVIGNIYENPELLKGADNIE